MRDQGPSAVHCERWGEGRGAMAAFAVRRPPSPPVGSTECRPVTIATAKPISYCRAIQLKVTALGNRKTFRQKAALRAGMHGFVASAGSSG